MKENASHKKSQFSLVSATEWQKLLQMQTSITS